MEHKKAIRLLLIVCLMSNGVYVWAVNNEDCNPHAEIDVKDTKLSTVIMQLAERHDFDTRFPIVLDKQVTFHQSGSLDDILKNVTKGMSTVIRKQYDDSCKGEIISELYFLPTGQKTDYINPVNKNSRKKVDYIYIDNMNEYVNSVLLGKRRADKRFMTPEQRKEYEEVKKKLRKQMKGQREKAQKPKRKHD